MKIQNVLGAVSACVLTLSTFAVQPAPVSGQGTWESTLQGRDLDSNLSTFEAYYDTVLDITWLADANYAGTPMNWTTANSWAAGLNPYGSGIMGWRLPDTSPADGVAYDYNYAADGSTDSGYNISAPDTAHAGSTASEMAHLFYNTLGNLGYCDPVLSSGSTCSGPQSGLGLSNAGPFSNVQSNTYWSATEYAPLPVNAWYFTMNRGDQRNTSKYNNRYAWAVHSGDVGASAVPVPAAVWLFGSGLFGLVGVARRRVLS